MSHCTSPAEVPEIQDEVLNLRALKVQEAVGRAKSPQPCPEITE